MEQIIEELEKYKEYLKKSDLGQRAKTDYMMIDFIIEKIKTFRQLKMTEEKKKVDDFSKNWDINISKKKLGNGCNKILFCAIRCGNFSLKHNEYYYCNNCIKSITTRTKNSKR